jgi:hypothetical protein
MLVKQLSQLLRQVMLLLVQLLQLYWDPAAGGLPALYLRVRCQPATALHRATSAT